MAANQSKIGSRQAVGAGPPAVAAGGQQQTSGDNSNNRSSAGRYERPRKEREDQNVLASRDRSKSP